jgi:hypothetical protein
MTLRLSPTQLNYFITGTYEPEIDGKQWKMLYDSQLYVDEWEPQAWRIAVFTNGLVVAKPAFFMVGKHLPDGGMLMTRVVE